FAALRVVDEPEGVAADAAHMRIHHGEHACRGKRCVHRRAAGAQRVRARGRGERVRAGHHAAGGERGRGDHYFFFRAPSFFFASAVPCARARSLAVAISRSMGAMPQFVQGKKRFAGTYFSALRMVPATSCGVSTLSVATSITPTSTSLPLRSPRSSTGTFEWMHSSETWSIFERASAGKISSYCRHSAPSVPFQSRFALMP